MQKRFILILEPSLTLRVLWACILTLHGYSGASYALPMPALADLRQRVVRNDALVLLSERQTHPDITGWTVLRVLQEWDMPLQVIFLLEHPRVLSAIEAQLAGACATIAKPFRIQHVLSLIEKYGQV